MKLIKNYYLYLATVLWCSCVMLLTGCASTSSPIINLQPQIEASHNMIGKGKSIVLQVIDARDKNSYSNAHIDPAQDPAQVFKTALSQGLQNAGFTLVPVQDSKPLNHFTVKILKIDYRTMGSAISSNNEVFVSAQVTVLTPSGMYTKIYNTNNYSDSYLENKTTNPSAPVNEAVSHLLNNILNDQMLMQSLAK